MLELQANREVVVLSAVLQCLRCGGLSRIVSLIVTVSWSSGRLTIMTIKARQSRGIPCADYTYLLALTRQLESVGSGVS